MRASVRRSSVRLFVVFVAGMLVASGPQIAIAAFDAVNADKVDGRHAVGASATRAEREGKLVAANAEGLLPANLIPKALDANRLDGLDGAAFQRRVLGKCEIGEVMLSIGAGGGVTCGSDRINGGNAQLLDGLDSTALARRHNRTLSVGAVGTPLENGTALRDAVATIPSEGTDAPGPSTPWLVTVAPGVYSMTTDGLTVPQFTTLVGAGQGTILTVQQPESGFAAENVVTLQKDASLRSVSVTRDFVMAPNLVRGVYLALTGGSVHDVHVDVSGNNAVGIGANHNAGTIHVSDVTIDVTAQQFSDAIQIGSGTSLTLRDSYIEAASTGMAQARGLVVAPGMNPAGTAAITNSDLVASGVTAYALLSDGVTRARGSAFRAGGPNPVALYQASGMVNALRVADSLIEGGVENGATLTCIGAYDELFAPLNNLCQ